MLVHFLPHIKNLKFSVFLWGNCISLVLNVRTSGIIQFVHVATGCKTRLEFKVGLSAIPYKNSQAALSISPFGNAAINLVPSQR